MFRVVFYVVLVALLIRAVRRLWNGVLDGMSGRPPGSGSGVPARGVQMVRDPVCGTFIVPDRALALAAGGGYVYFCSPNCRDKYRA